MAKTYPPEIEERVRTRRYRAARRQHARLAAARLIAADLDARIAQGPPADHDADEAKAFMSVLHDQRRLVKLPSVPAPGPSTGKDVDAASDPWAHGNLRVFVPDPRFSEEDLEELRRMGVAI